MPEINFARIERSAIKPPAPERYRQLCELFVVPLEDGLVAMGYLDQQQPESLPWHMRMREIVYRAPLDADLQHALVESINFAMEGQAKREAERA